VHSIDRKSGIVRTKAALKIVATTAAGHLILRLDTAARSRFRRKAKPQRQARGDEQPEANGDHRNQDSHLGPHSLPRRARPLSAFCPNLQRTPPSRIMFIRHERYERISLRALGQAGIIVISPWPRSRPCGDARSPILSLSVRRRRGQILAASQVGIETRANTATIILISRLRQKQRS
jgi:hypothetical protein